MRELLIKLKLIDFLTTNLTIDKSTFVQRLSSMTDTGSTSIFSGPFEAFSSSKNEFKGQVNFDGFKLKKRRRLFDVSMNMAIAKGTLIEKNGQLIVETEINGFNNIYIVFYALLIVFYSIFIFGFSSSDTSVGSFALPFILLHGTLMFSIPYFVMRRSVKRLKYELDREFFFLTKN